MLGSPAFYFMYAMIAGVRRYVDAGADRLVFDSPLPGNGDLGPLRNEIARYRDEVITQL